MLRFLTAGESHGKGLVAIVEGMPAGLRLSSEEIDKELKRRQAGYGRGGRMKIEADSVEILSGLRNGKTLSSPIAILIENKDWESWKEIMTIEEEEGSKGEGKVTKPRPGHADLAGAIKYDHKDIRDVLERSSARETAARVAVGAIAKKLLKEFGISVRCHVIQIGPVKADVDELSLAEIMERAEASPVRCADEGAEREMIRAIDEAKRQGDTLGGVCEIIASGCPVGLGSYVHWDRKLDGRLAGAVISIPGVKGVEVGLGFKAAELRGSQVHDEIFYANGFYRKTNNAGGIEGGVSNGEDIVIRAAMKPIPTLRRPLRSVDIVTKEPVEASKERSDICAVPAMGVIAEAVVAFELANMFCEKFGGDSLGEMKRNYESYLKQVERF